MGNFKFNKTPLSKANNSAVQQKDFADLAMVLIYCLSRSEQFVLNQYITSPVDLFLEINKQKKFPIIDYESNMAQEQPTGTFTKVINFLSIQNSVKKNRLKKK